MLRTLKSMLRPSVDRLISRLDKRHDNVVPVDYGDGDLFIYADSEFERTLNPWVAGDKLPADLVRDLIEILTSIREDDFLLMMPGRPSGFKVITEESHAPERDAMKRIEGIFPASKAIKIPNQEDRK